MMRWPGLVAFLIAVALMAFPMGSVATAQTTTAAPSAAPDAAAVSDEAARSGADALIRLLEDPDARDAMIRYLKDGRAARAEAPTPAPAEEAPDAATAAETPAGEAAGADEAVAEKQPDHLAVRIAQASQGLVKEAGIYLDRITRSLSSLPRALTYASGANWGQIDDLLIQLALLVAATVGLLYLLRRLSDRFFARMAEGAEAGTIMRRAMLLLLRAGLELVIVGLCVSVGYAVAISYGQVQGQVELVESLFLNAFFFVQIAKVSIRFALSPKFSALRLVPLDDAQALYWRRWLFVIVNVLGYGTMVATPLVSRYISFVLADSLRMILVLLSVGLAIFAILRNRLATRQRISAYAEAQTNMFTSGVIEVAARTWHLVAIFYVLLLLSVWLARPIDATAFMMRATALSVLSVMIGTLVSLALTRAIAGGIRLPGGAHTTLPLLERRLNTFIPRILSLLRLGVFVGVVVAILHAWGAVDAQGWFRSADGRNFLGGTASAGIVLLVGFLIWLAVMSWVDLKLNPRGRLPTSREKTLFGLFRNAFSIVLVVMVALLTLSELGVNIGPLIAGAGVFGLAISFGSQKLVQDIINGAFIQFENAMNEGDVVTLGGVTGTVENLTIRSVRLRDLDGTAHVIPFSTVDRIANFMRGYAYHVAAIGVAYDSDIGQVKRAMETAFERLKKEEIGVQILEPLEMHGVTTFGDSAITVRARIKTVPGSQWAVGRAYNEKIKAVFDEEGIEIPFPQVTYHAATPPVALPAEAAPQTGGGDRSPQPRKRPSVPKARPGDMPEGEDEL
ncbi:mechanosensitive ion channel [Stappia taiwanensis]|uniref:Mechanosensitive ion channel n=1 Tax=Stappia taiwanensis TaxID=992267 RepID=A0A838XS02_9HYPH|nr:mechanosensitive ion channel domain-containing protein [Stappia taiwanensis]MBA4612537.1 mechanosensitive ion channel [Stappia taiwanensis]GGF06104.1 mechanosensitive ion channel protein MscS [Stappia taiwanensis]